MDSDPEVVINGQPWCNLKIHEICNVYIEKKNQQVRMPNSKEIESLEKLEKKLAVEIVREIERTERGGIKKIVIKTRNRKNRKRNN